MGKFRSLLKDIVIRLFNYAESNEYVWILIRN